MSKAELKVEIDEHLLEQVRASEIQVALHVERALKAALDSDAAQERADRWAEENAEAIASHNRFVEKHGAFGAKWRRW